MSSGRESDFIPPFLLESIAEVMEKCLPSFRTDFVNLPLHWQYAFSEMCKVPMENGLTLEVQAEAYKQRTKNEERIGNMTLRLTAGRPFVTVVSAWLSF